MTIFGLKTKIRRELGRIFNFNRPTSYPFISGDGFRALAQHVYDELSDIQPHRVEKNDIVFVRGDFLKEFFKKKHPYIKNSYILISHNMDTNITAEYEKYLDGKIIHWFAQNLACINEKMTPLPIGVTNYYYSNINGRGKVFDLQKNISDASEKSLSVISFGFSWWSNEERLTLEKKLEKNDRFKKIKTDNQSDYYEALSRYGFTVSPEGNGIDCYKTWEALYLAIIPIVKKSAATEYFKATGIPLLIVEHWDELDHFDENFLSKTYADLRKDFKNPALYVAFWAHAITSKRIS